MATVTVNVTVTSVCEAAASVLRSWLQLRRKTDSHRFCSNEKFLENLWPARKVSESKPRQPGSIWTKSGSQAQSGFNEKPQNFGITPENGVKQRFCGFVVLQTLWPETMTKIPHHCTPQMIERFASIRTRRLSCFRSSQLVQLQLEQ